MSENDISASSQDAQAALYMPCVGNEEKFFAPAKDAGRETFPRAAQELAIAICEKCVIKDACLEGAIERGERYGVWGGVTERQLRKLQRLAIAKSAEAS